MITRLRLWIARWRRRAIYRVDPALWAIDEVEDPCDHADCLIVYNNLRRAGTYRTDRRIAQLTGNKLVTEVTQMFVNVTSILPPLIVDTPGLIGGVLTTGLIALDHPEVRDWPAFRELVLGAKREDERFTLLMAGPETPFYSAAEMLLQGLLAWNATPATIAVAVMSVALLCLDGKDSRPPDPAVEQGDAILAAAFDVEDDLLLGGRGY